MEDVADSVGNMVGSGSCTCGGWVGSGSCTCGGGCCDVDKGAAGKGNGGGDGGGGGICAGKDGAGNGADS